MSQEVLPINDSQPCPICFEDIPLSLMVKHSNCGHKYHRECLRQLRHQDITRKNDLMRQALISDIDVSDEINSFRCALCRSEPDYLDWSKIPNNNCFSAIINSMKHRFRHRYFIVPSLITIDREYGSDLNLTFLCLDDDNKDVDFEGKLATRQFLNISLRLFLSVGMIKYDNKNITGEYPVTFFIHFSYFSNSKRPNTARIKDIVTNSYIFKSAGSIFKYALHYDFHHQWNQASFFYDRPLDRRRFTANIDIIYFFLAYLHDEMVGLHIIYDYDISYETVPIVKVVFNEQYPVSYSLEMRTKEIIIFLDNCYPTQSPNYEYIEEFMDKFVKLAESYLPFTDRETHTVYSHKLIRKMKDKYHTLISNVSAFNSRSIENNVLKKTPNGYEEIILDENNNESDDENDN